MFWNREPGKLLADATPFVPYWPLESELLVFCGPFIHAQPPPLPAPPPPACVVALLDVDCADTFAGVAASYAATVYVYCVFAERPVST